MDLFLPSLTSECAWCKRKLRSQTDKTQSSTYLMCECGLLFCSIACHKIANKAHGVNCKKAVAQQQSPNIPDTVTEEYLTIDEKRLLLSSDTLPDFNMCPICIQRVLLHSACHVWIFSNNSSNAILLPVPLVRIHLLRQTHVRLTCIFAPCISNWQ